MSTSKREKEGRNERLAPRDPSRRRPEVAIEASKRLSARPCRTGSDYQRVSPDVLGETFRTSSQVCNLVGFTSFEPSSKTSEQSFHRLRGPDRRATVLHLFSKRGRQDAHRLDRRLYVGRRSLVARKWHRPEHLLAGRRADHHGGCRDRVHDIGPRMAVDANCERLAAEDLEHRLPRRSVHQDPGQSGERCRSRSSARVRRWPSTAVEQRMSEDRRDFGCSAVGDRGCGPRRSRVRQPKPSDAHWSGQRPGEDRRGHGAENDRGNEWSNEIGPHARSILSERSARTISEPRGRVQTEPHVIDIRNGLKQASSVTENTTSAKTIDPAERHAGLVEYPLSIVRRSKADQPLPSRPGHSPTVGCMTPYCHSRTSIEDTATITPSFSRAPRRMRLRSDIATTHASPDAGAR